MSVLNFNLGVLGHVDSGKTTLAKALSTVASTACFDKNPQSKERGITLDLGFSSFTVDFPQHLKENELGSRYEKLQFTLVDCPGHASLIKTIIGGAQIIDMMLLVIDIVKGMQTQTAECLVIGEITCDRMVVVLNKIDLLPIEKRQATIERMSKKVHATLKSTKFKECKIVAVSAFSGDDSSPIGIKELMDTIITSSFIPDRDSKGPLLFAVDHCFSIKGQGTVMTGTVLQGSVRVNDTVEIASLKLSRKVKSMQMFRQAIDLAVQGDRLGLCVTQFDPKLLERGLVCTPGALPTANGLIVSVEKIPYFKQAISHKGKFHITSGHETLMAKAHLFKSQQPKLDFQAEYPHLDQIPEIRNESEYYFAVLELDRPVPVVPGGLIIGSKFDADIHSNACRIAFRGTIHHVYEAENYFSTQLPQLKVFKIKHKEGIVERMSSPYEVIGRGLFKKETNIQLFVNLKVTLSTGEVGLIEGTFGQSGKVKIRLTDGLKESTQKVLSAASKKKKPADDEERNQPIKIVLTFKRYIYDPLKKIIQNSTE